MNVAYYKSFDFYLFDEGIKENKLFDELRQFVEKSWSGFQFNIGFLEFSNTNFLLCEREDFRIRYSFMGTEKVEHYEGLHSCLAPDIKSKPTGKVRLILHTIGEEQSVKDEYVNICFELYDYLTTDYKVLVHNLEVDDVTFCNLEGHYINYR